MASSDVRHGQNGVRGIDCLFKLVAKVCGMERKTASQGDAELFAIENGSCEINKGFRGL